LERSGLAETGWLRDGVNALFFFTFSTIPGRFDQKYGKMPALLVLDFDHFVK
jgi:hypothetical protein